MTAFTLESFYSFQYLLGIMDQKMSMVRGYKENNKSKDNFTSQLKKYYKMNKQNPDIKKTI